MLHIWLQTQFFQPINSTDIKIYHSLITGGEICQQPPTDISASKRNSFWVEMGNRPLQLFFCAKSAAIITCNVFQSGGRYAAGHCDRDGPQNTSEFPGSMETAGHPRLSQLRVAICSPSVWWSG